MTKIQNYFGLFFLIVGLLYLIMYLLSFNDLYSLKSAIFIVSSMICQKIDQLKKEKE